MWNYLHLIDIFFIDKTRIPSKVCASLMDTIALNTCALCTGINGPLVYELFTWANNVWGLINLFCSSPVYLHGLTLIPVWICYHIHYKVWDEITYSYLFNGAAVVVKEWISNSNPTLYQAGDYLSMLGLKLIHFSRRNHRCPGFACHWHLLIN